MTKNDSSKQPDAKWLETTDGASMGKSLNGFGVNLLVGDVGRSVQFLTDVLEVGIIRADKDFVVAAYGEQLFFLHGDHAYPDNPLPSLLPEAGMRGAGVELRLYNTDPDRAEARAKLKDHMVLRTCENRPHGLRECYLLDPDGYCWIPSRPLGEDEVIEA